MNVVDYTASVESITTVVVAGVNLDKPTVVMAYKSDKPDYYGVVDPSLP